MTDSLDLVFCFDGTCNGRDDEYPTNILKLHRGIDRGDGQVSFYYAGPGDESRDNWLMEALGALFGAEAGDIRDRALATLKSVYRPDDRIAVFGFSRGAMIARLFAASVCKDGVGEYWPGISFLGCFDTVAAFLPFGEAQQGTMFHDLHVPPNVGAAYHAVALDETREAFAPNLMNHRERVTEVWFKGDHCDIGGGHKNSSLSDVTLDWMIANAFRHGLQIDIETHPDSDAPIGDVGGHWRREMRDIIVKVDDERSHLEPVIYRP